LCEPDCNANGTPDDYDIATGTSADCDGNAIPDSCDIAGGAPDCNQNGVFDSCEIATGAAPDCNANGVPDACDLSAGTSADCNANSIPDTCDVATGFVADCNSNGVPDECEVADATVPDCNGNSIPDSCDIASGAATDIDADGTPDSCEDCNGNGLPDDYELAQGAVPDCNQNGVPDTCDIASGLDEDCDANGVLDRCDVFFAGAADDNLNCVPDLCEYAVGDFGLEGSVGGDDLAFLLSAWGNADPFSDLSGDGVVGGEDLSILLSNWGTTRFVSGNCNVLPWATTLDYLPDAAVVVNPTLREAIISTGQPWRVRDNGTQIEMVLIPPGTFEMGCSASLASGCPGDEMPVHSVTLSSPFYVGRYEVTQAQWSAAMGANPAYFQGNPQRPVELVSWNMVQGFLGATSLRLPTEAEWEYACRAGTTTAFHGFTGYLAGTNDDALVGSIAWFKGNNGSLSYNFGTKAVGQKLANGFGLYDMSGNVQEWVSDWTGVYPSSPSYDPNGSETGTNRVLRGGWWNQDSNYLRSSERSSNAPQNKANFIGFRVARNPL
jgi:formylglycine-generating enzyme required for sulfatase activity